MVNKFEKMPGESQEREEEQREAELGAVTPYLESEDVLKRRETELEEKEKGYE